MLTGTLLHTVTLAVHQDVHCACTNNFLCGFFVAWRSNYWVVHPSQTDIGAAFPSLILILDSVGKHYCVMTNRDVSSV